MQLEYNIYQKRNKHRRRRNLIRRMFLVLFIVVIIFFVFKIYSLQYRKNIEVSVLNNSLVNLDYLNSEINKHIKNKNFFLISTRDLSNRLIDSCGLLSDVVARKYIFPKYQIILLTVEKKIWAKVVSISNNVLSYVTDDGELVDPLQVNINLLPEYLTSLYLNNKKHLNADAYQIIKEMINMIHGEYNLRVEKAIVTNDFELNIICDDLVNEVKGLKINLGRINNELINRTSDRLSRALELIGDRGYLVEYIDLNLDNSVVFKELKNVDNVDIKEPKKKGFFKRKKY